MWRRRPCEVGKDRAQNLHVGITEVAVGFDSQELPGAHANR